MGVLCLDKDEKKENKEEINESQGVERAYPEVCPECGGNIVMDAEHGVMYCENCGYVIEENIVSTGPEWRGFDYEQALERSRTGRPITPTSHDFGFGVEIALTDSEGSPVPPSESARIRRWTRRISTSGAMDRNLRAGLSEIERLCTNLRLPRDVREYAARIYREATRRNLIRGRSISVVAGATVYAACRRLRHLRTLQEVSRAAGTSKKEISRTYKFLSRHISDIKSEPPKPEDYVDRFCDKLGLGPETIEKAKEILRKAKEAGLTSGRGPQGMAAAAIYIAAILTGNRKTQKEVAQVANVTEVTIRNRYKELTEKLGLDIST
ncbi:MAG: transcription initiation factor IIB [Thermoplasmata archaeon]|nr:MAG: transcription initiation factor IIB [Thermoplasmata archaeon]